MLSILREMQTHIYTHTYTLGLGLKPRRAYERKDEWFAFSIQT